MNNIYSTLYITNIEYANFDAVFTFTDCHTLIVFRFNVSFDVIIVFLNPPTILFHKFSNFINIILPICIYHTVLNASV